MIDLFATCKHFISASGQVTLIYTGRSNKDSYFIFKSALELTSYRRKTKQENRELKKAGRREKGGNRKN